jgi:DNA-binding transcriptional regulator/RsmH inhibitor MraZ
VEQKKDRFEFEGRIDGKGRIAVPAHVYAHLKSMREGAIHVQLSGIHIARALRAKGVSEEEVSQIVSVQRETREHVVRFLLSEGRLLTHSARTRRRNGRRQRGNE